MNVTLMDLLNKTQVLYTLLYTWGQNVSITVNEAGQ